MATSAPFSAAASAIARPSRLAAPVTRMILPERACPLLVVISRFYAPMCLETLHRNCYTPSHDGAPGGYCLFPQGMSSLRNRQGEPRQTSQTWRFYLARSRRRLQCRNSPPLHRRGSRSLHQWAQSGESPLPSSSLVITLWPSLPVLLRVPRG